MKVEEEVVIETTQKRQRLLKFKKDQLMVVEEVEDEPSRTGVCVSVISAIDRSPEPRTAVKESHEASLSVAVVWLEKANSVGESSSSGITGSSHVPLKILLNVSMTVAVNSHLLCSGLSGRCSVRCLQHHVCSRLVQHEHQALIEIETVVSKPGLDPDWPSCLDQVWSSLALASGAPL
ncbi:hypothetical protein Tco_0528948 [Tanacetum coccineum]